MKLMKTINLRYNDFPYIFSKPLPNATHDEQQIQYFSSKINPYGCLLLVLIQYMQQYFDRINYVIIYKQDSILPNSVYGGSFKETNCSEIDVGVNPSLRDFLYCYEKNCLKPIYTSNNG